MGHSREAAGEVRRAVDVRHRGDGVQHLLLARVVVELYVRVHLRAEGLETDAHVARVDVHVLHEADDVAKHVLEVCLAHTARRVQHEDEIHGSSAAYGG